MGRLDDPSWWWEYALDGVIGGIIGGLVTALAVWLTLRHERRLVREARERELEMSDLMSARTQALHFQAALWRFAHTVRTSSPDDAASTPEWANLLEARVVLFSIMAKRWLRITKAIDMKFVAMEKVMWNGSRAERDAVFHECIVGLVALIGDWMRNPEVTPPDAVSMDEKVGE